jgi:DNA adenine methylase
MHTPPLLRWAGSKKRSLPSIKPYVPKHAERYVELFAGSACLFFALAPKRAVLNDTNIELVRFYKVVARHPSRVYASFVQIPRTSRIYYKVRANYGSELNPIRRAANFLYLNRNCFNGIYRTNVRGEFNVPFSESRVAPYPTKDEVGEASRLLSKAVLRCEDFQVVCRRDLRRGDFAYLDPPYYRPIKRVFVEYSAEPFDGTDITRLQKTLQQIDRSKASFLLSYPKCAASERIARDWNSASISVRRTIAGDVASRRRDRELLIFNYDLIDA